jgi:hypothetical protein
MQTTTTETELLDLERRYWQALKDKDTDTAMRLTDDSCIVAGPQGFARMDKATMEQMMKSADYSLEDFEIDDGAEVRMLSDDVAVLAYKVHETLKVDGQPVALDAAESSAWVRRDGRWVCALHTEALVGDPFGRDKMSVPSGLGA